jgi:hypothetical protein
MHLDPYYSEVKEFREQRAKEELETAQREAALTTLEKAVRDEKKQRVKMKADELRRKQAANKRAERMNTTEFSAAMGWITTHVPIPFPEVPLHDGDDPGWKRVGG